MKSYAVVEIQGKQYIVQKGDAVVVENLNKKVDEKITLPTLMYFDSETAEIELKKGEKSAEGKVIENCKGEKIRVANFKSKVRFRKVRGFRPHLTKIEIVSI